MFAAWDLFDTALAQHLITETTDTMYPQQHYTRYKMEHHGLSGMLKYDEMEWLVLHYR